MMVQNVRDVLCHGLHMLKGRSNEESVIRPDEMIQENLTEVNAPAFTVPSRHTITKQVPHTIIPR